MGVAQRVLLVIDDELMVCRGLARLLGPAFQSVHIAGNPGEAEQTLDREPITHLLCDHYLGPDQPTGLDLVPRWRERFPGIAVAVVLSGSEIHDIAVRKGIDGFVSKPPDASDLRVALGIA